MILNLKIDSYNVKTKIKTSWQNIFIVKKEIILYEGTRLLKPNLWILLDALLIQSASMKKGKKIFYICNICYEKGKSYRTGKLMLWMLSYFLKNCTFLLNTVINFIITGLIISFWWKQKCKGRHFENMTLNNYTSIVEIVRTRFMNPLTFSLCTLIGKYKIKFVVIQSLSHVWLCDPWTATGQAPLSSTTSRSLPKFMSIEWMICYLTILFSATPFSFCLQSFPASGFFQINRFFTSGGQRIGASTSETILPKNIQGWFPLELTGLISLQFKGLSRVFSNNTIQKHQFSGAQSFLWTNTHICIWLLEKP